MDKQIEQFYKDNYNALVKRLTRRAGGVENAEDVIQEAFVRALKYSDSFNPERQELGAWFNSIMNNALVVHQRTERLGGATIPYEEEDHEPVEECMSERKRFISQIIDRVEAKDERHRSILHLHFICEYRIKEVQEVVGGGYGSVQKVIQRFKLDMLEEFGNDFEDW